MTGVSTDGSGKVCRAPQNGCTFTPDFTSKTPCTFTATYQIMPKGIMPPLDLYCAILTACRLLPVEFAFAVIWVAIAGQRILIWRRAIESQHILILQVEGLACGANIYIMVKVRRRRRLSPPGRVGPLPRCSPFRRASN